jgi:rhamnogalacturonyl hydrolase YesR
MEALVKRGLAIVGILIMCIGGGSRSFALEAEQVRATIKRVGDWQLANPVEFGTLHWAVAPLLDGLIDLSLATGDPKYLAAVVRAGTREGWRPGPNTYHADDLAAGHAWTRIYLMDPSRSERLAPFKSRVDAILANPIREDFGFSDDPRTHGVRNTDRWTWVDALYMAPPALAALAKATGNEAYLRFVDAEFKPVLDTLYDPEEKLFYRDDRYIGARTPNGEKVFWSRGNGWVLAGLPLLLNQMPADYPMRDTYVGLFKEMAGAVLAAQQPDGSWYASLKDPRHIPLPETSGSALFVFGLSWGVRHGLLDRATYWPAVERGWDALVRQISRRGVVGAVQPIGAEPAGFGPASNVAYGTGAVLMAGAEILRAVGGAATAEPAELVEKAGMLVGVPDISRQGPAFSSPLFDREYSVDVLTKIARPVLEALSEGKLHARLPVHDWERPRAAWTHYEAFARTLAGIAPWLELGPDDTHEGRTRARFIDLARKSLINATDPASPDYMNFGQVPDHRAYRIGQEKPVFVHKLIVEEGIEAAIEQLKARKAALADALFAGGAKTPLDLTEADISALFAPLGSEARRKAA